MDSFGSDEGPFLQEENFYFHADPYVQHRQVVTSSVQWFWLSRVLHRLSPQLSSLDYAFSVRQARVA
jgi:hypothetical protein